MEYLNVVLFYFGRFEVHNVFSVYGKLKRDKTWMLFNYTFIYSDENENIDLCNSSFINLQQKMIIKQ